MATQIRDVDGEIAWREAGDMVRVTVDQTLCIGGGICEMLEPEVFELDNDTVISSVIGNGLLPRSRAETAVDRCPSRAIAIVKETTEQEL